MPRQNARSRSCWTCKLRRKKCDYQRPICRACTKLQIACYDGETKPEWMESTTRQREMMESIKQQIKRGTSARREAQQSMTSQSHGKLQFVITPIDGSRSLPVDSISSNSTASSEAKRSTLTPSAIVHARELFGTLAHTSERLESVSSLLALSVSDPSRGAQSQSSAQTADSEWDMDFIMVYLDHVFPFMFPFYRPPLLGTSRAWLLKFITQNEAVFHSIISLSSYFFTCGLNDTMPDKHEDCKKLVWEQVLKQADLSSGLIQKYLRDVNQDGAQPKLSEKVHLMESIVQILVFEALLSRSSSWGPHLPPAIAMFEEIIHDSLPHADSTLSPKSGLRDVLSSLVQPSLSGRDFERFISSPAQESFRFFSAILIYIDIISSASLGQPLRLQKYHAGLLADLKPCEQAATLDLFSFVGCQNWALLALGEIATLSAWKREMQRAGMLSMIDLVGRSTRISQNLLEGLAKFEVSLTESRHGNRDYQPFYDTGATTRHAALKATQIWARSAQLYLFVVISGWQPAHSEVHQNIEQLVKLLENISCPAQLRALAWPVCVTGCLAYDDTHRKQIVHLIDRCNRQQPLSTLQEAKRIIEAVWNRTRARDGQGWDLEACFEILGAPPLLV